MKVLFMASGGFALPALETLHRMSSTYPLVAVVTRPDRPARRGRKLQPTPVRQRAAELGLPCLAPESTGESETLDGLRDLGADLFVVADYGEILRPEVLSIPSIGAFNLHGSLLPAYRGAAPVAHALLADEECTGVTLFRIEPGLDSGPIVASVETTIEPEETAGELEHRLAVLAAELLEKNMAAFASGSFRETPQDHTQATKAPKLEKQRGEIDWSMKVRPLCNFVRALNPWPMAFTHLESPAGSTPRRVSLLRVTPGTATSLDSRPGTVVDVTRSGFEVTCADGSVSVLECQREGKAVMSAAAFLCGHRLKRGDLFVHAP